MAGPAPSRAAAAIGLNQETAWRLLFKMIGEEEARGRVRIDGETALATAFLRARAVMA